MNCATNISPTKSHLCSPTRPISTPPPPQSTNPSSSPSSTPLPLTRPRRTNPTPTPAPPFKNPPRKPPTETQTASSPPTMPLTPSPMILPEPHNTFREATSRAATSHPQASTTNSTSSATVPSPPTTAMRPRSARATYTPPAWAHTTRWSRTLAGPEDPAAAAGECTRPSTTLCSAVHTEEAAVVMVDLTRKFRRVRGMIRLDREGRRGMEGGGGRMRLGIRCCRGRGDRGGRMGLRCLGMSLGMKRGLVVD